MAPAKKAALIAKPIRSVDKLGQAKAGMPLPLKVKGNQILNSKNQPVTLRGVNTSTLEFTSDGEGHIIETIRVAIDDWQVNIIRLPLSQDRWFGKAPDQNEEYKSYRVLVKEAVDLCNSKGCYIILDLHWSDANEWGKNIGQQSMPDRNSVIFWKDIASLYANNPSVLFDLYNEPRDVTWDVWLNGGMITSRPNRPGRGTEAYNIRDGGNAGNAEYDSGHGRKKRRCRRRPGLGIRFQRDTRRQTA